MSQAKALELAQQGGITFPASMEFLFQDTMLDGLTPVRYKVPEGGRGGGKTENIARALLMLGAANPERYMCTREYQVSIKQSVHKTIADAISVMKMNYLYEVLNTEIKHRAHDTSFFFEGLHGNIDKIKSYAHIRHCWIEEAHNTTKDSFEKLDPTIRMDADERSPASQLFISFNPELETDFIYDFFVPEANRPKDAIVKHITWRDNPWFPDVLWRQMLALRERDYDAYLNVWEGKPKLILAGAVYAEQLRAMRLANRYCKVPHNPSLPVHTSWDLGHHDKTSIWFFQQAGFEYHFIDYYENQQQLLPHYVEWMQARRGSNGQHYVYGMHFLPHDADYVKGIENKFTARKMLADIFGDHQVKCLKRIGLETGINAARMIFPLCYFDTARCVDGVQALSHYRYEVVDEKGRLSRIPVHDEYSHGADSFRYFALSRSRAKQAQASRPSIAEAQQALLDGYFEHSGGQRSSVADRQLRWMGK